MTIERIPLTSGMYQARSVIASAQRCVNLYPEKNAQDSPFPVTNQLTPGLTPLIGGVSAEHRCAYTASNGQFYEVVGNTLYLTSGAWVRTTIGTIGSSSGVVSISDNGIVGIIVDNSSDGWVFDLISNAFDIIQGQNGAFFGGTRVDYVDTFFILNRPGTNQWYVSLSNVDFNDMIGNVGGALRTGNPAPAGSGYTTGSYANVPLTAISTTGSGFIADIAVSGGVITGVSVINGGSGYRVGDLLGVDPLLIGGTGSGFKYQVATIIPPATGPAFDPLDIATKTGNPDPIQATIVMHREVWLIGTNTTEVWYDAGNPEFSFAILPGVFIEHGCIAPYSICKQDLTVYWLSQDRQGTRIVLIGVPYAAKRISTHAIEQQISGYSVVSDAVGFTYQQLGHTFYVLTFPTANATWVYDVAEDLWHERTWTDSNGLENRIRPNTCAAPYGTIVIGDWETGDLYQWDLNSYTDNGSPIVRRRSWPDIQVQNKRAEHTRLVLDMDVGEILGTLAADEPQISLRYSDTRGKTWGTPRTYGLGSTGEFNRSVLFPRLGQSRNRVYEAFWDTPAMTALNGGDVWVEPSET